MLQFIELFIKKGIIVKEFDSQTNNLGLISESNSGLSVAFMQDGLIDSADNFNGNFVNFFMIPTEYLSDDTDLISRFPFVAVNITSKMPKLFYKRATEANRRPCGSRLSLNPIIIDSQKYYYIINDYGELALTNEGGIPFEKILSMENPADFRLLNNPKNQYNKLIYGPFQKVDDRYEWKLL